MSFYQTPDGRIIVEKADCLDWMGEQADNSIAGIVTDPAYGLGEQPDALQMLKAWLEFEEHDTTGKKGFMQTDWDAFVPGPRYWREALRITKPGGFAFVFGGCRTYDLTVLAMRIAGWEIRTCIMWVFSSSMLHGINVSKAIDKAAGAEREVLGEKVYGDGHIQKSNAPKYNGSCYANGKVYHEPRERMETAPATPLAQRFEGYQSKMAAGYEPIVLAMVPLEGTFAANAEKWDVAGLNLSECRIPLNGEKQPTGSGNRNGTGNVYELKNWVSRNGGNVTPAAGRAAKNFLHDNSQEVLEVFGRAGVRTSGTFTKRRTGSQFLAHARDVEVAGCIGGDTGTADRFYQHCEWTPEDKAEFARFYYCAKASKRERGRGNNHATVKPIKLLQYLLRLVKQPGDQEYADLFGGSFSTAVAARREGMRMTVVELEEKYCKIGQYRLENEPPRLPFIDEEDEPPPVPTMGQIELF